MTATMKGSSGDVWRGRAIAWMLALAPVLLILATYTDHPSMFQIVLKSYAIPMLVAEVMVVVAALIERAPIGWPPRAISLCLATFLLHAWVAAIRADDRGISVAFTFFMTLHIAFGIAVFALIRAGMLTKQALLNPMLAGFALFAGAFLLFVALHAAPGYEWIYDIPAFRNIRWLGYYIAAMIGLCAAGWMHGRRLHLALGAAALAIALWTGSRGTLAAICGGYVLAAAIFPFLRRGWHRFVSLIILGIALAVILDFGWPLEGLGPSRLIGDSGSSGRWEIWIQTSHVISAHPWMGYGEAQFGQLINESFVQPHNIVLQLLLAWGVAGAVLIAILATWLANKVRANISEADAPFFFAAANLMAFSLIDGSLFHVLSMALFALCVGVLGAASRRVVPAS